MRQPDLVDLETWLERFGTHTASYVLLEGSKTFFVTADIDGFLGWEPRYGCRVIAGDPVCDPKDAAALLQAFRRSSWPRPVYAYAASPAYRAAFSAAGFGVVPIGAEATFDPSRFTLKGGARATMRAAVNHARSAGVTVHEHDGMAPDAGDTNAELLEISNAWLGEKGDGELGFLLGRPVFDRPTRRRTFLARSGDRIEGFLVCAPILARGGWYLDITRRRAHAIRGTMELLTATALESFGHEGSTFASMGLAPLARLEEPDTPPGDSASLLALLRRGFQELKSPYDYQALARYKSKCAPDAWEPRLFGYSGPIAERMARAALGRGLRRSAP